MIGGFQAGAFQITFQQVAAVAPVFYDQFRKRFTLFQGRWPRLGGGFG